MKTILLRLLLVLASGYATVCLLVFIAQRRMLYFPSRQSLESALREAQNLGLEPWQDDHGKLLGWRANHPAHHAEGTLLVLHGNAGEALDRTYLRDAFQAQRIPIALDVVLLEFPGYGPREGATTETTLVRAAVEAIDKLHRESDKPIFLLGESLGSAVAALAAAQRQEQVKGLLLITPLKSIPAVARRHYPLLPPFLALDTLRTDRALARLRMPVGFLIAGKDDVAFPDLGMELFHDYTGSKRIWVEPDAGHNTLDYSSDLPRWEEMIAFLRFGTVIHLPFLRDRPA